MLMEAGSKMEASTVMTGRDLEPNHRKGRIEIRPELKAEWSVTGVWKSHAPQ